MQQYLLTAPKFGNNIARVDNEAAEIANRVSDLIASKKNYLGNPFRLTGQLLRHICFMDTG